VIPQVRVAVCRGVPKSSTVPVPAIPVLNPTKNGAAGARIPHSRGHGPVVGWIGESGAMAHPLTRYRHNDDNAAFVLHGVGHALPCVHHSPRIWGGEVQVWAGVGGCAIGVRTTATTSSSPFPYANEDAGPRGRPVGDPGWVR
jgi:hypothetical protein